MKKWAYYNDNNPYVCEWARNLIKAGLVTDGVVDERPISEVTADDIKEFKECHFFCGILGWPLALKYAGWEGPVWTGSCPCQPLSSAGQRKGHADERHLWPAFHALIAERRPATVFGEQVASKLGREWLAGVRADLEHLGYAVGAADLPAAGVGSPHIRQRLWWVADAPDADRRAGEHGAETGVGTDGERWRRLASGGEDGGVADATGGGQRERGRTKDTGRQRHTDGGIASGGLADAGYAERRPRDKPCDTEGRDAVRPEGQESSAQSGKCGEARRLGNADKSRPQGQHQRRDRTSERASGSAGMGFWDASDIIPCGDGKARRIEPGTFPLAHGVPARVGKLRAYGNAITPQTAAEFIRAIVQAGRKVV